MNRSDILPVLKKIVQTFEIQMNYYSVDNIDKSGVKEALIKL
jgi:hypothetical protein